MGSPFRMKAGPAAEAKVNAAKWQKWKDDAEARGAPVDDPMPLIDLTKPDAGR